MSGRARTVRSIAVRGVSKPAGGPSRRRTSSPPPSSSPGASGSSGQICTCWSAAVPRRQRAVPVQRPRRDARAPRLVTLTTVRCGSSAPGLGGRQLEAEEQPVGDVAWRADRPHSEMPVEPDRPGVVRPGTEMNAVHPPIGEGVEHCRQQPSTEPPALSSGKDVDVNVGRELLDDDRRRRRRVMDPVDQLFIGGERGVSGRIGIAGSQGRPPTLFAGRLERGGVVPASTYPTAPSGSSATNARRGCKRGTDRPRCRRPTRG